MILVTGSGGVLGRALAAELETTGKPCTFLTSKDVDLCDMDATLAAFRRIRPEVVFHLAGRVHGLMGNMQFPGNMILENLRINTNVIEAAREVGVRKIVGVSTVAIYSADAPMPVSEGAIWNGPPHHGEAAYGHAKRVMLAQLEAYATQYGIDYAYPIMTNIFGPHDRFDVQHGHVVPSLIAKAYDAARTGQPLTVWGTGIAERDFLASDDAARALVAIADRHTGPINVASGRVTSIRNLVESLCRHAGIPDVQWDRSKPDGQVLRRYDVSKLAALGFEPRNTVEQAVAATYDWYARNMPHVRR